MKCEFCNESTEKTIRHHLIPRWLNGSDLITVCKSCHVKLEHRFNCFIKYGQFKSNLQYSKKFLQEGRNNYNRKYVFQKQLGCTTLMTNLYFKVFIKNNINTGTSSICQFFVWQKRGGKAGRPLNRPSEPRPQQYRTVFTKQISIFDPKHQALEEKTETNQALED